MDHPVSSAKDIAHNTLYCNGESSDNSTGTNNWTPRDAAVLLETSSVTVAEWTPPCQQNRMQVDDDDDEEEEEQAFDTRSPDTSETDSSDCYLTPEEDPNEVSPASITGHVGPNEQDRPSQVRSTFDSDKREWSIEELSEAVRAFQMKQKAVYVSDKTFPGGGDDEDLDPEFLLRLQDFYRARRLRRRTYGRDRPIGVFGLFYYLTSLRTDLAWANNAAWRRDHGEPFLSWTDFAHLNGKTKVLPVFTSFMVMACSISLVIGFWLNHWKFAPVHVNPMFGPSPEVLIEMGALDTTLIVVNREFWRLLSPAAIHAGIIHYVINMLAIWFIGGAVEREHGTLPTVLIFVLCVVGGNLLSALFMPHSISVGASGGIFGMFGVCLADIIVNWHLLRIKEENGKRGFSLFVLFWLGLDMVLNSVIGLTPYIDNFAHLGGLFYGSCLGLSVLPYVKSRGFFENYSESPRRRNLRRYSWAACRASTVVIALALFGSTLYFLVTTENPTTICVRCRYISCVPFPFWKKNKWWYCDGCDFVEATLYTSQDAKAPAEVELTCPLSGDVVTIKLKDVVPNVDEVRSNLTTYCRDYCMK